MVSWARGVGLLLGIGVLAACGPAGGNGTAPMHSSGASSPGSGGASSGSAGASAPAPKVCQCRLEKAADITPQTNDSPVVPCTQEHTALTVAVTELPARLHFGDPAVDAFVLTTCAAADDRALGLDGATRALSIFDFSWFEPSKDQQAAGARWIRCDVNAYTDNGADVSAIYDLPDLPLAAHDLPEQLRKCFSGTGQLTTVSCSQPHSYRAQTAVRQRTHGGAYPAPDRLRALADAACNRAVGTLGTYAWTYPTPADWAADQAWFACLIDDAGTSV